MFNRILAGVDGHEGGRDAIALATQFAEPEAKLVLAHVCGTGPLPGVAADAIVATETDEACRLLRREQEDAGVDAELAVWADRKVGRGLHALAEDRQLDLLVIGSSRHGRLGHILLGDHMLESLHGAPSAVAIAPRGYAATMRAFATIGIGFDGSTESEWALGVAQDVANRFEAQLKALSVVSLRSVPPGRAIPDNWPEFAKHLMDIARRRLDERPGVQGEVRYGEPSEELARFAEQLDLLVVGSRSYGPLARVFTGSTSNHLARRARCPLLVLPRSALSRERQAERALQADAGAR